MVKPKFHIAGLGCSAGCLDVLRIFFSNLPERTGVAYVIVQHLSRSYKSMLDKLLQPRTRLPIVRIGHDTKIEPDHIYLMPEGKFVQIEDGVFKLIPRRPEQIVNYAVNIFLKSLAVYAGSKAIGIILAGMGWDGLEGARAIDEHGGKVFVQDPSSTLFKGMLEATIRGNNPAAVMQPTELARMMAKLCQGNEDSGKDMEIAS